MIKHWWKALATLLILYSIVFGFLGEVSTLPILNETIRVLYFHVPMWFSMIALMGGSMVFSIRYLSKSAPKAQDQGLDEKITKERFSITDALDADSRANILAKTGFVFAFLGLISGSIWARFTWGAFWVNDPKLNGTAITILAYLAYFVLRGSVEDENKRARLAAVYNIFAFVMMIVFIGILPRLPDSLHPGNGGNPAFGKYDLDNNMRPVFYSAALGWILIGYWIAQIRYRIHKLQADV